MRIGRLFISGLKRNGLVDGGAEAAAAAQLPQPAIPVRPVHFVPILAKQFEGPPKSGSLNSLMTGMNSDS